MKKLLFIPIITLLLSSCNTDVLYPTIILRAEVTSKQGCFRYKIAGFPTNISIFSDQKYNVGDTLKIVKQ